MFFYLWHEPTLDYRFTDAVACRSIYTTTNDRITTSVGASQAST